MCGGRGARLDADVEKPLYEVGDRPMVDRVLDALLASRIDAVHAVCSPHAPATREHLAGRDQGDCPIIDAPGEGYVADLQHALERADPPVLTVAADLPLLAGDAVERVLDRFAGPSLTVCVPVTRKQALGVSVDATMDAGDRAVAPTGVNVVSRGPGQSPGGDTETYVTDDARLAVNVNRLADARVAEELLAAGDSV